MGVGQYIDTLRMWQVAAGANEVMVIENGVGRGFTVSPWPSEGRVHYCAEAAGLTCHHADGAQTGFTQCPLLMPFTSCY